MTISVTTSGLTTTAHSSSQSLSQPPQYKTAKKVEEVSLEKVYKIGDQAIIWGEKCIYRGDNIWEHPEFPQLTYSDTWQKWLRVTDTYGDSFLLDSSGEKYEC